MGHSIMKRISISKYAIKDSKKDSNGGDSINEDHGVTTPRFIGDKNDFSQFIVKNIDIDYH